MTGAFPDPGKCEERRYKMVRRFTRRNFLNYAAMAAATPIFEVKPLRGLDFILQNSPTPRKFLIETMPGGAALFDYNNDGLLDIFLVNGGRVTEALRVPENFNRNDPRYWNRLYRQNRARSFADVTHAAGLSNAGNGNYGMGVAVGDYDNDGYPDLYVTSYGKNILYHNNGDGTFTDVTAKAGVAGGGWSVSAGFFDYDNDGHLDLFVTRYMDWDADHNKICGETGTPIARQLLSRLPQVCCITIAAMAPSRMSASVQELWRKRDELLALRSRTITAMVSPILLSPMTACSNIFFTTTETALSRNVPWNQAWG